MVEFKVLQIEFARIHDDTIMPQRGQLPPMRGSVKWADLKCPACGRRWTARPTSWSEASGGNRLACPGCRVDGYFRPVAPGE